MSEQDHIKSSRWSKTTLLYLCYNLSATPWPEATDRRWRSIEKSGELSQGSSWKRLHDELHEGDDRWTNMKISARAAPERDNNNHYHDHDKESVIGSPWIPEMERWKAFGILDWKEASEDWRCLLQHVAGGEWGQPQLSGDDDRDQDSLVSPDFSVELLQNWSGLYWLSFYVS